MFVYEPGEKTCRASLRYPRCWLRHHDADTKPSVLRGPGGSGTTKVLQPVAIIATSNIAASCLRIGPPPEPGQRNDGRGVQPMRLIERSAYAFSAQCPF